MKLYYKSIFFGLSYFINDGSQNFLTFQPIFNTLTMSTGFMDTILEWKSKGLSNNPLIIKNQSISPKPK